MSVEIPEFSPYTPPPGWSEEERPEVFGPGMWKQLHERALTAGPLWRENQWLLGFVAAIPCSLCRSHFVRLLSLHPPDFSDYVTNDDYFRLTVQWHNAVNTKLGKPQFSLEDAYAKYGRPEPR